jgi:hypothetical protein
MVEEGSLFLLQLKEYKRNTNMSLDEATIKRLGLTPAQVERIREEEAAVSAAREELKINVAYSHPQNANTDRHVQYGMKDADDAYQLTGTVKKDVYNKMSQRVPEMPMCPTCCEKPEKVGMTCSQGHNLYERNDLNIKRVEFPFAKKE